MSREVPRETAVTVPPDLLQEAQRIADQEKWSVGDAVVFLAKCGAESQKKAEQVLEQSYREFMADPKDQQAGNKLICSIFGSEALTKD